MTGCSPNEQPTESSDVPQDGTCLISESSYFGNTYSSSEIPFDFPYGENYIQCLSVDLYQEPTEHGYYVYAIVAVDMSELSDTDIYWIDKNEEFKVEVVLDNDKNNLEAKFLSNLCQLKKDDITYYAFDASEEFKYAFDSSNTTIRLSINNEDVKYTYRYSTDIDMVKDTSSMDKDIYSAMSDAYQRQLEFWREFIN